jgi:DHA2 family multidrug resistance protein-like MFS transporter
MMRPLGSGRLAGSGVRRHTLTRNDASEPGRGILVFVLFVIFVTAALGFVIRQRRAAFPLYELEVAMRRIFWVAACAGIIVFGTLMAAMFIGQQYLQYVLGYNTLQAGAAMLPAALFMVSIAPRSAKLVESYGSRLTLLIGYTSCFIGFVWMLLFWS